LAAAARAAVGRLVGWLRDRFAGDSDQAGVQALAAAEKYGCIRDPGGGNPLEPDLLGEHLVATEFVT
jgi:hypothetical protein